MDSQGEAVVSSWDGEALEVNAAYCVVNQVQVHHWSMQVVEVQCG